MPMPTTNLSLDKLRTRVTYLVRPHHFWIAPTAPASNPAPDEVFQDIFFYLKNVTLPSLEMGTFEVAWFGLKFVVAGDPTNQGTTDFTYLYDTDSGILRFFQSWQESIVDSKNDTASNSKRNKIKTYKCNWSITQLGQNDEDKDFYTWTGFFPTNVQGYEVNHDTTSAPVEFTVTMSYDWWWVVNSKYKSEKFIGTSTKQ